jgi:isoleucyl-tRNA synthetase
MNMEKYDLPSALAPILPFLDDASNWYIRRSRRRFWKSGDDGDKQSAYITLHYVLVRLAYVLAPFVPFLAEELYRNLTDDHESIHLKTWIEAGHVDQIVLNRMEYTRTVINDGLSQRAKAGIKVRQPLQTATVYDRDDLLDWEYIDIIIDELNLKTLTVQKEPIEINILDTAGKMSLLNSSNGVAIIHLDFVITPELKREGLMREVVRHVQSARKAAGLNVDDRIVLSLTMTSDDLTQAIEEHAETIKTETLTTELVDVHDGHETTVKVEGSELRIRLKKCKK